MKTLYFLLASLVIAGCAYIPRYTFDEVGTQSNDPQNYGIISDAESLRFQVEFASIKKNRKDEKLKTLSFKMNFTNSGTEIITLKPVEYKLVVGEDDYFLPTISDSLAETINLQPQNSTAISLNFDLPISYNLAKEKLFQIAWNYKIGNYTYRRVTNFIKKTQPYHYPSFERARITAIENKNIMDR
jgi:hypothetical protein